MLSDFVRDARVVMIGPIRQELLSGISSVDRYETLREKLSIFGDFPIATSDYELAARYFNDCRKKSVQGSHIDFLICTVAAAHDFPIFTLDRDFESYRRCIPIKIVSAAGGAS